MMIFEYKIPDPGDKVKVKEEWKVIKYYSSEEVFFTDGSSIKTSKVTEVQLLPPFS